MEKKRRWTDAREALAPVDLPAIRPARPPSVYERLSRAWSFASDEDRFAAIARLRREAEERMERLSTPLSAAGLCAMPASACASLWDIHSTITGGRVVAALTIGQIEEALRLHAEDLAAARAESQAELERRTGS